jgi:hypothetical protein
MEHRQIGFGRGRVCGVRRFDASLGGLGGHPYAPGAMGDVNFENAAFMPESMSFDTDSFREAY